MFKIVNETNLEEEHICCALSEKKGEKTTSLKKNWMTHQFDKGLVFKKLDVRGKVFIEYIPSENAFAPIVSDNDMYINCLWVSGKFKNQGYADQLLTSCIDDAQLKNKDGVIALSSTKKRHFLSDPDHLKHYGFHVVDTYPPDFELLYYPLKKAAKPYFRIKNCIEDHISYYSHQCPHTEKYALLIQEVASKYNIELQLKRINSRDEALEVPCPFTTYALFLDRNFVTTEVLTEKKFVKILEKHMLI